MRVTVWLIKVQSSLFITSPDLTDRNSLGSVFHDAAAGQYGQGDVIFIHIPLVRLQDSPVFLRKVMPCGDNVERVKKEEAKRGAVALSQRFVGCSLSPSGY